MEEPAFIEGGRFEIEVAGERFPAAAGLRPERWTFRRRLPQAELRDWLSIPVLTDALLPDLAPDERIGVIAGAYAASDLLAAIALLTLLAMTRINPRREDA